MTDRGVLGGWRQSGGDVSLPGAHQTIAVNPLWPSWRKMLAFLGPGYLVAVGYMDPAVPNSAICFCRSRYCRA
ncbi:MAG: divalent metal cation transporter MntH [Pseudomonadota bacterium]